MKKITLLILFFVASLTGFSQELVTNGDFESAPTGAWFGNALNIVTQGSNNLNEAEVVSPTPGAPFNVNLSQEIALQDGLTYQLTFDAFTDATTGSRTIVAGLGQNGSPFNALTETPTITSTSQTFSYTFTINYGDAVNDRVLFDLAEEAGFVFIDNVSVVEVTSTCNNGVQDGDETGVDCGGSCPPCVNPPDVAAPTPPARPAADVISIYGDAYGTPAGLNNVGFDDPTEFVEETHAGDEVLKIDFLSAFMGASLGTVVDATDMTFFHMDFWISDDFQAGQVFNTKWSNHSGGMGETDAGELTIVINPGDVQTWVSIDVPLTDFNNVNGGGIANREALTEFLITAAGLTNVAYLDNVYFHKNTTVGTEDFTSNNFSTYPNPTSDSWTITSQNENIKTVEIFNTLGRLVKSIAVNDQNTQINASDLSSGIYFAKVSGDNNQATTLKLIKK
ncbi:MAG: T9SS type A sorting domain-containing protein [Bacteroidetes bacterium]|jgi:endoglucanase|nr:T9SS type A sorting domain-containing protein [Bacteroidota bacterium]